MGYFEKDAEEMLDVYLLESEQLLDQADSILLRAEERMGFSSEEINHIFRIMHTMKSSSAMMGLNELSILAHRLEDLFDVFRKDMSKMEGSEQAALDLIFAVSDFMKAELSRMRLESYQPSPVKGFEEKISRLISGTAPEKKTVVRIQFEPDCQMENVRAFLVVRQIMPLVQELTYYPDQPETNSSASQTIREEGFWICFQSGQTEQVLDKIKGALFVESVSVEKTFPSGKDTEKRTEEVIAAGGETDRQEPQTPVWENAESETPPSSGESVQQTSQFINVPVQKLDELLKLTGELMIALQSDSTARGGSYLENPTDQDRDRLRQRLMKELEELTISIRMVPFASVTPRLNRIVRDICRKEQKKVSFLVTGQEVEADKKIVDRILEPLIHLIRNAVDHGVETPEERRAQDKPEEGKVVVSFENAGGEIVVSVSDDGSGFDLGQVMAKAKKRGLLDRPEEQYSKEEILELCLLPGFSTCDQVNEYSGRGVGLDVVRQMTEQFGGHLYVETSEGCGSRFHLHFSRTLALVECMRLSAGGRCFGVPSHQVMQFYPYQSEQDRILLRENGRYWIHEERLIPVISLRESYQIHGDGEQNPVMIWVKGSSREACLIADHIEGQDNMVEKPVSPLFGRRFKQETGISGMCLWRDGSVCLQLDVEDFIRIAEERGGHE
jgi:two-component system chemotaxis sensor kinase CheA